MTFPAYGKTRRLDDAGIAITEKIDGTNGLIEIGALSDGSVYRIRAGSRNRWLNPAAGQDNYGFGAWVQENENELAKILGPGLHYGEWWGQGIARGYGMDTKVFSLFNTRAFPTPEYGVPWPLENRLRTVPVIGTSHMEGVKDAVAFARTWLEETGSRAAPGFMRTEGVVVRSLGSGEVFKVVWDKANEKKARPDQPVRVKKPPWTPEQIAEARAQKEATRD